MARLIDSACLLYTSALDYLIKVRKYSFMDAVEILTGKDVYKRQIVVRARESLVHGEG